MCITHMCSKHSRSVFVMCINKRKIECRHEPRHATATSLHLAMMTQFGACRTGISMSEKLTPFSQQISSNESPTEKGGIGA
jgi:hypothetical protein